MPPITPQSLRVAGKALGFTDAAGDAIRQLSKPIRAYHGSPYDFDAFDASKIGTGSGAQKYGYGLYFAGAEPTATTYKSAVSAIKRTPQEDALEFWRRAAEVSGNKQKAVLDALDRAEVRLEEAAGMPEAEQRWKEIIKHLYELDYRQPLPRPPGRMYEVEIDHPEESLLDWNAPLSQQPESVRAAYASGARGYHGMTDEPGDGDRLWYNRRYSSSPAGAAEEMLRHGIPGIRYQEQSRNGPVVNYVMFPGTEDKIRILRKYGLLLPAAAAGTNSEE